jgi:PadR family transcriptional regulator PadR
LTREVIAMVSKELIAASSKPLILGILARGESYGYAIIQEVRDRTGGALEWTEGMLYPVLHRLEREELIRGRWRTSEAGRRRRYYSLGPKGKQALEAERRQWSVVHSTLSGLWEALPCST